MQRSSQVLKPHKPFPPVESQRKLSINSYCPNSFLALTIPPAYPDSSHGLTICIFWTCELAQTAIEIQCNDLDSEAGDTLEDFFMSFAILNMT